MLRYITLILCLTVAFDSSAKWLGEEDFIKANTTSSYTAVAVDYDGTNDYLVTTATNPFGADAKTGTFSAWIRIDAGDGAQRNIAGAFVSGSSSRFLVRLTSGNLVSVLGRNSGSGTILDMSSTGTYTAGASWIHILAAWDLAAGTCLLYVNDTDVKAGGATCINDTIDYTVASPTYRIGADAVAAAKWNGCMSEVWFRNTFIDISNASNRLLFRTAGGKPANLGSDGSTPGGAQPPLYLKTASPDAETNSGSGGNFTETGAIDACSTSPSD